MRYYDLSRSEMMKAITKATDAQADANAHDGQPVAFNEIIIAKLGQLIAIRAAYENLPYQDISDVDLSNRSDCGAVFWVDGCRVGVEVKNHLEPQGHFADLQVRVAVSFYGMGRLLPFQSAVTMLAEPDGPQTVRVIGRIHSWQEQALDRVEGEQGLWGRLKSARPRQAA